MEQPTTMTFIGPLRVMCGCGAWRGETTSEDPIPALEDLQARFNEHWVESGEHDGPAPRIYSATGGSLRVGAVDGRVGADMVLDHVAAADGTSRPIGPPSTAPGRCVNEFGPGLGAEYRCVKDARHPPPCEDQYENTWTTS